MAERLRHAAAEGRLLAHELEERLGHALRAQTYGELDRVVADLPGTRVAQRSRSRQLAVAHPIASVAVAAVVAVVAMAVIAVLVAGLLAAWMVWMVFVWLAVGHRYRHRHRHRRAWI